MGTVLGGFTLVLVLGTHISIGAIVDTLFVVLVTSPYRINSLSVTLPYSFKLAVARQERGELGGYLSSLLLWSALFCK